MLSRKEQERLYKVLEDVSKTEEWPSGSKKPSRWEVFKALIAIIPMKRQHLQDIAFGCLIMLLMLLGLRAFWISQQREDKAKSEYLRSEQQLLESQRQYHDILSNHVRWMDEHLSNIDRMLGRTNGEWKTK